MSISKLKRIITMSPLEILVRSNQLFSLKWDQLKSLTGLYHKKPKNIFFYQRLCFFKKDSPPYFFLNPHCELTKRNYQSQFSERIRETAGLVENIMEHKFDLLGYQGVQYSEEVEWNMDKIHGKCAPELFWGKVKYLDFDSVGDSKIVWEINRLQHLYDLGKIYWLTKDERYAEAAANQINHWIERNPYGIGINWASSLEVAIRSISLIWAIKFFSDSPSFQGRTLSNICHLLECSGTHLSKYTSYYFAPNTHLTGEALGLFYIGTLFPEFKKAAKWSDMGRRILNEQVEKQVRQDGTYHEQSIYYQRYTIEIYLHYLQLSKLNNIDIPENVPLRLEKMIDCHMHLLKPSGKMSLIGDDDGGRLTMLERGDLNDHRFVFSTAAILFKRADFKWVSNVFHEESFFLLGESGRLAYQRLPGEKPENSSSFFRNGGNFVLRTGWEKDSTYIHFDAGPQGMEDSGHGHADMLSFELHALGQSLIVDPGTYTYTGSESWRNYFNGTPAHNTISVDGEDQSLRIDAFKWDKVASPTIHHFEYSDEYDFIDASHNGYERLICPVIHRRQFFFNRSNYLILNDRIEWEGEGEGDHLIELFFHFAPGTLSVNNGTALFCREDVKLWIIPWNPDILKISKIKGWVSEVYGKKEEAPILKYEIRTETPMTLSTLIYWEKADGDTDLPMFCESATEENSNVIGFSFEIKNNKLDDVVHYYPDKTDKRVIYCKN